MLGHEILLQSHRGARKRDLQPDGMFAFLRHGSLAALLACSVTTAFAAQHGVDLNDVNKSGAACTDFFDYANGAWRSSHAIP